MGFRIVVGADEAGEDYKDAIKADLLSDPRVDEVIDVGITPGESIAYPHKAVAAARTVAEGKADRGILVCGTGMEWQSLPTKSPASEHAPLMTAFQWNASGFRTMLRCSVWVSA